MHLAVEKKQKQIVSFLLFDARADPNKLSADGQMAPLHVAVQIRSGEIIELLLACDRTDIDVYSDVHGTPLHLACRGGSIKVVQQLLLNNADFMARSPKGKLAKEMTKNQRIVYLIEKYEKRFASRTGSFHSTAEDESKQVERRPSQSLTKPGLLVREEDIIYEEEEELERQAGGVLDQAEEFIKDFTHSRIELVPTVKGYLLAQGQLFKKQKQLYFVLLPCKGELMKFEKQDHYERAIAEQKKPGADVAKVLKKLNAEVVRLNDVVSVYPSFRTQFINKQQHCIEVCCYNEQILYFAAYDSEQTKQWLAHLSRAKKFFDWYQTIRGLLM